MIRFCIGTTAMMLTTLLAAQTKPTSEENPIAHVRISFTVVVNASYAQTATLFGPSGERVWAGEDWDPQFIYPSPERDVEGAVFTVQRATHKSVWVNSIRDIEARHFQYVYFVADTLVTTIDVRFSVVNAGTTAVEVVYTRTALTPEASNQVRELGEKDRASGGEWQQAIERYLKEQRSTAH